MLFYCKIPGRARTKKNSKEIIRAKGRHIPVSSKTFLEWEKTAMLVVANEKSKISTPTIKEYCTAIYTFNFKNRQGEMDTSNGIEGIADVLEKTGIVKNDKLIKNFYAEKNFGVEDSVEVARS